MYDAVGGGLEVEDLGPVRVALLVLVEPVTAVEDRVIGGRPRFAECLHRLQDGCLAAAGRGLQDNPGICHDVGDGLVGDDHGVLAGGAQLADSMAPNRSASVSRSNCPLPWTTISSMNGLCLAGSSTVATWMSCSR
jgi:hypothetical protein